MLGISWTHVKSKILRGYRQSGICSNERQRFKEKVRKTNALQHLKQWRENTKQCLQDVSQVLIGIVQGSIVTVKNVSKCHQRSELKWKGCVLHNLRWHFKRSYCASHCAFDTHSCWCHHPCRAGLPGAWAPQSCQRHRRDFSRIRRR